MAVYLLHLMPAVGHSKHYIGWSPDAQVHARIKKHTRGAGSALCREAVNRGSQIVLVMLWPHATKEFERRLKRQGGAVRWCPECCTGVRRTPAPRPHELTVK